MPLPLLCLCLSLSLSLSSSLFPSLFHLFLSLPFSPASLVSSPHISRSNSSLPPGHLSLSLSLSDLIDGWLFQVRPSACVCVCGVVVVVVVRRFLIWCHRSTSNLKQSRVSLFAITGIANSDSYDSLRFITLQTVIGMTLYVDWDCKQS